MTITDHSLGLGDDSSVLPVDKRDAARGIIFNEKKDIALVYTNKHGHHKLPGGGIEDGEGWKEALIREAIEEVGCRIIVRDLFVGKIVEIRNEHGLMQTSYCAVADVFEYVGHVQLTEEELEDGYTGPKWISLDGALKLFKTDQPKTYLGRYMHARDQAFLNRAIEVLQLSKR